MSERSRRIVSVVTPWRSARSATSTEPCRRRGPAAERACRSRAGDRAAASSRCGGSPSGSTSDGLAPGLMLHRRNRPVLGDPAIGLRELLSEARGGLERGWEDGVELEERGGIRECRRAVAARLVSAGVERLAGRVDDAEVARPPCERGRGALGWPITLELARDRRDQER